MKKPVIGLTSSFMTYEERDLVFLPHPYFDAIRHFGGIPVLIPVMASRAELEYLMDLCDGLILTGGDDIDPKRYGEETLNDTVCIAPERDAQEGIVIDMAVRRNLPIFGICRGIQMMNVHFGGTLYQDIPAQIPTEIAHSMAKPHHRTCHECRVVPGTPLHDLCGCDNFNVNSHHHQAVKDVAPGFLAMGHSEDGIIEAICDPSRKFCWGVQWHPEKIWDMEENAVKLFEAFIEACK